MKSIFLTIALALVSATSFGQGAPNLQTLSQSGYFMGPGNSSYPIHSGWVDQTAVMKSLNVFDAVADRIERVVCGSGVNKSVLIIGEPSLQYKYLFARLASRPNSACPQNMWHVDINISKIESGHMYVGQVDEYWNNNVLGPADKKDVVLYFQSLGALVGLGSHSNDDTGIEREYVANFIAGRLRTVAFMDKFEYNEMSRSRNAYVIEAFADRIVLPQMEPPQVRDFAQAYLNVLFPAIKVNAQVLNYMLKFSGYYAPNRGEPDRTVSILNELARLFPNSSSGETVNLNTSGIETKDPYDPNTALEFQIDEPTVQALQLSFERFDLESGYDYLTVSDARTGVVLERLTGQRNAFRTAFYATNKLKLVFQADSSKGNRGFKVNALFGKRITESLVSIDQMRLAIMKVAQVPEWLITKDFKVISELQSKLDGDVVGVTEGKRDLVKLAKNGYVAGRTDDKPIATVMLTGPTGTGKSYIAKKLADFLGMQLITIDMTSYKESSTFKTFQEVMARNLTNSPWAVYLFEEIDKASIEALDQLYFMMDEGVFYDQYQRPLFARGAFMLFTTNAASDVILNNPNAPDLRARVMDDLRKMFRMSFINRFDAISIFKPFTDAEFAQLSKTLLDKKIKRMKEFFDWTVTIDQGTYDYITTYGKSAEFGARPMERLVESSLGVGIAEYQLAYGPIASGSKIEFKKLVDVHQFSISANGKSLVFDVQPGNMSPFSVFSPIATSPMFHFPKLQKFFDSERLY